MMNVDLRTPCSTLNFLKLLHDMAKRLIGFNYQYRNELVLIINDVYIYSILFSMLNHITDYVDGHFEITLGRFSVYIEYSKSEKESMVYCRQYDSAWNGETETCPMHSCEKQELRIFT